MKYETAWIFYKSSRAIAKVCKVTDQAVSHWKKRGIIPIYSAVKLQKDSRDLCKVDPAVYTENSQDIEQLPAVVARLKSARGSARRK